VAAGPPRAAVTHQRSDHTDTGDRRQQRRRHHVGGRSSARGPDTAIAQLESLLTAAHHRGIADIDGRHIDLSHAIATNDDRREARRWLWTIALAEGIRALARAGRWEDALTHAHRHHGIGDTLWVPRTAARHATCRYSWISPPRRSRRRWRMLALGGVGVARPAGGC
jgi:hypothetical protein